MKKATVLLTGISGYIGLHTAKILLDKGFNVRGSIRNKSKAEEVKQTLTSANVDTTNLSLIELDLTSNEGWDNAASDCEYVIHMASPFVLSAPKNEQELIVPAVQGTMRAIQAAKKAGVKRVVLTASSLTMMGSMKTGTFGPDDWTDVTSPSVNGYTKSKTLAEKAAWDFIKEQTGKDKMELVSIHPGGVFGPPLGNTITGQSMSMIDKMLRGKVPMMANVALPMVDVRDVAKLHVQAMTTTEAAGKRIVASLPEATRLIEIPQILKQQGYKGPSTIIAPNFLLRIMSLFDSEAKGMVGMLGMDLHANNNETSSLFNWKPRPFSETVIDSAIAIKRITNKT